MRRNDVPLVKKAVVGSLFGLINFAYSQERKLWWKIELIETG
jgi:hypothetical protein